LTDSVKLNHYSHMLTVSSIDAMHPTRSHKIQEKF